MHAEKSRKLDLIMKRLYALGAPKAGGLNFLGRGANTFPIKHLRRMHDDDLIFGIRICVLMGSLSILETVAYPGKAVMACVVLLALNKDVTVFTEARTVLASGGNIW